MEPLVCVAQLVDGCSPDFAFGCHNRNMVVCFVCGRQPMPTLPCINCCPPVALPALETGCSSRQRHTRPEQDEILAFIVGEVVGSWCCCGVERELQAAMAPYRGSSGSSGSSIILEAQTG